VCAAGMVITLWSANNAKKIKQFHGHENRYIETLYTRAHIAHTTHTTYAHTHTHTHTHKHTHTLHITLVVHTYHTTLWIGWRQCS